MVYLRGVWSTLGHWKSGELYRCRMWKAIASVYLERSRAWAKCVHPIQVRLWNLCCCLLSETGGQLSLPLDNEPNCVWRCMMCIACCLCNVPLNFGTDVSFHEPYL